MMDPLKNWRWGTPCSELLTSGLHAGSRLQMQEGQVQDLFLAEIIGVRRKVACVESQTLGISNDEAKVRRIQVFDGICLYVMVIHGVCFLG